MRLLAYGMLIALSLPATMATAMVLPPPVHNNCKNETLTISTPHNYQNVGFREALSKYAAAKRKVGEVAKSLGVDAFVSAESYSLRARNTRGNNYQDDYTLNGTVTYKISKLADAQKFQEKLADAEIYVNANYNMRDNCKR